MKHLPILALFFLITCSVSAQKVKEADVPQPVRNEFSALYQGAKPAKWEKEKNNYEAELTVSGSEISVLIDPSGKLLETETEMPVSSLPALVREACAKNFAGKKIKEASRIVDDKNVVKYEAEIDGKDYLFDESGKMVK